MLLRSPMTPSLSDPHLLNAFELPIRRPTVHPGLLKILINVYTDALKYFRENAVVVNEFNHSKTVFVPCTFALTYNSTVKSHRV